MARRMQRAVVVLPQPDSPTRPSVSPCSMAKLTSSHRPHRGDDAAAEAATDLEELLQPAHLEDRALAARACLDHESASSRW